MPKKKKKKGKKRAKTARGHTGDDGRANWLESLKKGFWIAEKVFMPHQPNHYLSRSSQLGNLFLL